MTPERKRCYLWSRSEGCKSKAIYGYTESQKNLKARMAAPTAGSRQVESGQVCASSSELCRANQMTQLSRPGLDEEERRDSAREPKKDELLTVVTGRSGVSGSRAVAGERAPRLQAAASVFTRVGEASGKRNETKSGHCFLNKPICF